MRASPLFDLADPAFRADPYPAYAELREQQPVYWSDQTQSWILTRYDDVRAAMSDPRFAHWTDGMRHAPVPFLAALGQWLWLLDPRSRSHLRARVHPLFSRDAVASVRPHAMRLASEISSALDGYVDLAERFAEPLTMDLAAELLGIPSRLRHDFAAAATPMVTGFPRLLTGAVTPSFASFGAVLTAAAASGAEGLVGAMLAARADGDDVTDELLVMFAATFVYAAQVNIRGFIGNAIVALSRRPDGWEQYRAADPAVAVEELLRIDSPVQFIALRVREDVELHGRQLRAATPVLASVAAANHDPRVFEAPEELRLDRADNPHVAFGTGALFCVGAGYARMLAQVALTTLAATFETIRVDEDAVRWRTDPAVLRGPEVLPARLERRPATV